MELLSMVFRLFRSRQSTLLSFVFSAIVLSIFLAGIALQMACLAGNNPQGYKRVPGKTYEDIGRYIALSSPIELPDVPQYTGRLTFVSGLRYPDDPHGSTVLLTYRMHEEMAEVLQWYAESLKSYAWKVQDLKPDTHQVLALKGRTACTILASACRAPGFRTEITITYKVGR